MSRADSTAGVPGQNSGTAVRVTLSKLFNLSVPVSLSGKWDEGNSHLIVGFPWFNTWKELRHMGDAWWVLAAMAGARECGLYASQSVGSGSALNDGGRVLRRRVGASEPPGGGSAASAFWMHSEAPEQKAGALVDAQCEALTDGRRHHRYNQLLTTFSSRSTERWKEAPGLACLASAPGDMDIKRQWPGALEARK